MVNVDFKFDFQKHFDDALCDSYQDIANIAKALDMKTKRTEDAIRELIGLSSSAFCKVLAAYNEELLNEIEL